jgi:hypothetical protein
LFSFSYPKLPRVTQSLILAGILLAFSLLCILLRRTFKSRAVYDCTARNLSLYRQSWTLFISLFRGRERQPASVNDARGRNARIQPQEADARIRDLLGAARLGRHQRSPRRIGFTNNRSSSVVPHSLEMQRLLETAIASLPVIFYPEMVLGGPGEKKDGIVPMSVSDGHVTIKSCSCGSGGGHGGECVVTQAGGIVSVGGPAATPASSLSAGWRVDQSQCSICLEPFVARELVRELPCGHWFHVPCVDSWLQLVGSGSGFVGRALITTGTAAVPECPLCKAPVFALSFTGIV